MAELSPVETLHCTPRRTRLRIASRAGSPHFFRDLGRRLSACHGVEAVRARPGTATVVIWHDPTFRLDSLNFAAFGLTEPIAANGRKGPSEAPPVWQRVAITIDGAIKKATRQQAGLPSVAIQLGLIAITRRPLAVAIHWAAETCLKAALKSTLTPKLKRV